MSSFLTNPYNSNYRKY